MKTQQEIQEADKREREIGAEKAAADKAAHKEFVEATKEEQALYLPALKRWLAFYRPYWEARQAKMVAAGKAEIEALAEVRGNWKVCPKCRTSAARYQFHCVGDKCSYVFPVETFNE